MLVIPGRPGRDTCDGLTRRELLRVGGSAVFGISLANLFALREATAANPENPNYGGPGFNKAKSVILVYLQGGPSHLDLWDPKDNVPSNVKSVFSAIDTKIPGIKFTEVLPKLAQIIDKTTLIRSMSYTPNGLFNHTAAIYQMLTGYTADKVSPSGQLEPPSPKDFPNIGSNIARLKPPTVPMLPFVMLPRPLQESNVVGKGGSAGFLGRAYDPYLLYPAGDDMDLKKMDRISIDDLKLRNEVTPARLERRAKLRESIEQGMPAKGNGQVRSRQVLHQRSRPGDQRSGAQGIQPLGRENAPARAVRQQHLRPEPSAGPAVDRGRHALRRGQLAQGRQLGQSLLGRSRRSDDSAENPGRPDV
jgi:hypothetical protein